MKRIRLKRRTQIFVEKLTGRQKDYLTFGRSLLDGGDPFRDEAHRRAVWTQHGEEIIEDYVLISPGKRPVGWWNFEAPEPCPEGESQAHYLRRHELLGDDEIERLTDTAFTSPAKTRSAE